MKQLSKEEIEAIRKDFHNITILEWNYICCYRMLSEDFIREFQHKINWHIISWFQNLSKEFIIEFIDKIVFSRLLRNKNLSQDVKDYCRMFI